MKKSNLNDFAGEIGIENNKPVLVYGFGSWGQVETNISQQVVEQLRDRPGLVKHVFRKVVFDDKPFLNLLEEVKPVRVLGLGQYPRGKRLRIEKSGYNQIRARGKKRLIDSNGVDTVKVNWHLHPDKFSWVSHDPGRFVCNFSIYVMGRWIDEHGGKYAFIHIPKQSSIQLIILKIEEILDKVMGVEK